MYHPDDRELDRLSAAAGENYTPPGNPNWDALEQTLNKELPQEKERRRRGIFWFFLLPGLFLAGAAYWYTRPAAAPKAPVAVSSGTNPAAIASAPGATVPAAPASTKTNERALLPTQKPVPMPNTNKNANDANDPGRKNYTDKTNNSDDANKVTKRAYQPSQTAGNNEKQTITRPGTKKRTNTILALNKKNNNRTDKTALALNNRKGNNRPAANTADISDPVNDKTTNKDQGATGQQDTPPVTTPPGTTPPATTGPGGGTPPPVAADTNTKKPDPKPVPDKQDSLKKKNRPEKAFSIGITGGIDMSTVKFYNGANAGYNIGLLGGYHFSEHWSVYTGAIYTKKSYKMEGYDYHAPANSWITLYNVKIDQVNGNCSMWELPLMGRYTFGARTNTASRFFAGAGISSYLMNREYYSYDYKRNGNPTTAEMTNTTHSQFWFSVLDFSAGIEKPLGHHLVGQLEPYAKLPLSGLGTGKIMLSSFGLNVTLQYRKKIGK